MYGNQLSGVLPDDDRFGSLKLANLCVSVDCYVLCGCISLSCYLLTCDSLLSGLTGLIPNWVWQMDSLQVLSLSDGTVSGTIPSNLLSALTDLTKLYVKRSVFDGFKIVFILYPCLVSARVIRNTNLSGSIPDSLWSLRNLTSWYVLF